MEITTSALPAGAVGVNYKAGLTAANGAPPYTWGIVSGQLPPGLSLQASTGQILGMPTHAGAFTFLAHVRDSAGGTASSNFSINAGTSSAPSVSGASPIYGTGFTSTGLTLNGNAAINGTRLRLTDGATGEISSTFFSTPVNVQSFTNDFSFQLTSASADGFTFTIQGNNPTALGAEGGNLGYTFIRKSVAAKFDLYNNAGEGSDSTGLYTNGKAPIKPAVDMTRSGVSLHSGHLMNVHMTYDGTTLVMQITDATTNATFSKSFRVDIPNTVGGNTAYVGFTGATGGLAAVQDIVNWTYVPGTSTSQQVGSPPQITITTSALPGGAVGVNYNAALAAANGVPPYTWGIVGGQLPPGLRLQASSGQISGMPTQAGAFSFQARVNDSTGATASSSFSINTGTRSAPIVSRVSPNSGPTPGGTPVTISGSNFQAGATVLFGGVTASAVRVSSATQIQVVTPAHIAGTVDVTVSNPDAESSTLSGGFAYGVVWPTVRSVSPNSGSTGGGTSVTITGTNFLAGALVLFGTTSAPVTASNETHIQAVTPANAGGAVDVTVENPGGQSAKLAGGFTYILPQPAGPPTIGGVSPSSGTPGTQVTITGTNFAQGATVEFGSVQAASALFVSTTQLTASVPSIGAGTYNVTVTNPDPASATLTGAFTVTKSQSLLAGATVSATNVPSVAIPSGWTLVHAEGFDSGSIGSSKYVNAGNGGISPTRPHTGTRSLQCPIDGDGSSCILGMGGTGSSNHIYLSYWRYMDTNACQDTEIYFWNVYVGDRTGFFDVMDTQNFTSPLNTCANFGTTWFITTGTHAVGTGVNQYGKNWNLPLGTWEQVEGEFKGSTCTNGVSNNDGLYSLWVNGQLLISQTNVNTNGCKPGFSSAGMNVEAGGVFTYDRATSGINRSPKGPFNVYIDDVILLKQ